MKQYHKLLKDILVKGTWKPVARENLPPTKSLFGTRMHFDLNKGFPLLTTKKIYFKAIIVELLWFLKGDTNIKFLVENGCKIWNDDAYRWYLKYAEMNSNASSGQNSILHENEDGSYRVFTKEEFIEAVKTKEGLFEYKYEEFYKLGDLGKVYGYQWRNQNGIDQLRECIRNLQTQPYGRYAIINAWNAKDFTEMALPPCHLLYQFNVRPSEHGDILDLQLYQRSCDTFLGVPFNIASGSLFLLIVSTALNLIPGNFTWVGGDTHIYENHFKQVDLQLTRKPFPLPTVLVKKSLSDEKLSPLKWIENLKISDLVLTDYISHPAIEAELSVGLKLK